MKAGERIRCPHCCEETFVKEEVIMDGWTVKGKILKCTMCGKKLADAAATAPAAVSSADPAKLSALASLLDEKPEAKSTLMSDAVRHFCKDCVYFIVHPFMTRCSKFDRKVDPIGDCPEFTQRPTNPEKEKQ